MIDRQTKTKDFSALPIEIKALRKGLGWRQAQLARSLGVFVGKNSKGGEFSPVVSNWERGVSKPLPVYRRLMVDILAQPGVLHLYKEALRCLKNGSS